MKAINDFGKHLQVVIREMCSRVGVNPEELDFGEQKDLKKEYFWLYEWTKEEEEDFTQWMADYLYVTTGARNELMSFPRKTKKACLEVARYFVWNHGWKTQNA